MYVVAYGRPHAWPNLRETFKLNFLFEDFFFACNPTLISARDSLGFEDCRIATHLLNYFRALASSLKPEKLKLRRHTEYCKHVM